MENKHPSIKIDIDYVKEVLDMTLEEQQEWLSMVLDYLKVNDLEAEVFAAAANVLDGSIIEDVKRWYNGKNKFN
jgi:hypothetical protein